MTEDVRAWPGLPAERRHLMTLLAGFRVAEDAVAEELTPFTPRWPERALWTPTELLDELLIGAEQAAVAWGDAVPAATRERAAHKCARRLSVAGLLERRAAA